jgi:hypothetical protein
MQQKKIRRTTKADKITGLLLRTAQDKKLLVDTA